MVKQTESEGRMSIKPKLQNFKDKTAYLRAGGGAGGLAHRETLEWHLSQNMCSSVESVKNEGLIGILKDLLSKSRTGEAFLNDADKNSVKIEFDAQIAISQFYPKIKLITLNSNQPKMVTMVHMIRELRRSWQYERNLLTNPLDYNPEEAVLLNRAQQADITMMSVRIAWELKLLGENELWDHLLVSSNADIARGFEMQARSDFRSLNSGDAARKAYDMWFAEERMRFHDKRIIHQMLLDDTSTERQENINNLDGEALYNFADMPYGKNYLTLSGYRAPTDRDYSIVEDRSNANFLWFIKFERSFQAREKEMMDNTAASPLNVVDINGWKQQRAVE